MMDKLLTVDEAAERLQTSVSTVRREIDRGHLRAVPVGLSPRITPEAIEEYLQRDYRAIKKLHTEEKAKSQGKENGARPGSRRRRFETPDLKITGGAGT